MSDIDKIIEKLEAIGVPAWEAIVYMVWLQGCMLLTIGAVLGVILACAIGWTAKNLRRIDSEMLAGPILLFFLIASEFGALGLIISGIYNLLATEGIAVSRMLG